MSDDVRAAIAALQAVRSPGGVSFRPDGKALAFTLAPATREPGESLAARLWESDLRGGVRQLTRGPGCDVLMGHAPDDASDDARLLFLSDRAVPGKMAAMIRHGDGRETALGDLPGTVEKATWSRDGASVLAMAVDEGLDAAAYDMAVPLRWSDPDAPQVSDPATRRRRLCRIDIASGAAVELDMGGLNVWDYAEAPTGALCAITSREAAERGWHTAMLVVTAPDGGPVVARYQPEWQVQSPVFAADGGSVFFLEGWASDRGLVAGGIRRMDALTGTVAPVAGDALDDITSIGRRGDAGLWFAGWQGFGTRYGVVSTCGATEGAVEWSAFEDGILGPNRFTAQVSGAPDGKGIAAIHETTGRLPEIVYRASLDAPWSELTGFNTKIAASIACPAIEDVSWRAEDGTTIHGLLARPAGAAATPGPLIVIVHGGPTASAKHMFDPCNMLGIVAAGYTALIPNYRGSVGHGQDFTRANIGDPGGVDFDDICAGVDWAVAQGIADPARIGITGVSYGGYMTAWAATRSERFAAAVDVAGISSLASCHYGANHAFCEWIAGGRVEEAHVAQKMIDRSPLTHAASAKTPVLFLSGALDRCTPALQAQELHAALAHHGVETQMVIYPREGHNFLEAAHQADARLRAMAWFDRYLKPGTGA